VRHRPGRRLRKTRRATPRRSDRRVIGRSDARELRTALRYPDVNVFVDLSQMRHVEKWSYVRSLLAGINEIRRRHGVPHRILVDEAHYLLHDAQLLAHIDLELAGIHSSRTNHHGCTPICCVRSRRSSSRASPLAKIDPVLLAKIDPPVAAAGWARQRQARFARHLR
jgi:hypothetical protein